MNLKSIGNYLSLVKFSHTVFALPFALIGFAIAVADSNYSFSLRLLLLIILCMIFARNAAMGFNRLADRRIDALNPRTRNREIPSGKIDPKSAAIFVIINSVLFILTTVFINRLTLILSPVALLIILGYSYAKRVTPLCHLILGAGLGLAPVAAYISVIGSFDILPLIYSFIVLTWVSGFDIIYSLQDDDFDRNNFLYSLPSVAGRNKALFISAILHSTTFILIIIAGITSNGGFLYWTGAGIFSLLLLYQHIIVKHDDLGKVNIAFDTTNSIASLIFSLLVIADLAIQAG